MEAVFQLLTRLVKQSQKRRPAQFARNLWKITLVFMARESVLSLDPLKSFITDLQKRMSDLEQLVTEFKRKRAEAMDR